MSSLKGLSFNIAFDDNCSKGELSMREAVQSNEKCRTCGEEFGCNNVFTESGKKEVSISGVCEVCFDNLTYAIDEQVERLVNSYQEELRPVLEIDGCFLAGGAMRKLVDENDEVQDIDLFFESKDALDETRKYFATNSNFKNVYTCPKQELFTYRNVETETKVQLVGKAFYSPEKAIKSFDITACCAAYDGKDIYKHRRFISDVMHKRININVVEYPNATMRRIDKYSRKGYTLTRDAIEEFVNSVNRMEITDDNLAFYID